MVWIWADVAPLMLTQERPAPATPMVFTWPFTVDFGKAAPAQSSSEPLIVLDVEPNLVIGHVARCRRHGELRLLSTQALKTKAGQVLQA